MRQVSGNTHLVIGNALIALGAVFGAAGCGGSGGGGGGSTAAGISSTPSGSVGQINGIAIVPEEALVLDAPGGTSTGQEFQIAVDGYDAAGQGLDVTREMATTLKSEDEGVVRITGTGLLQPVAPGKTKITATWGGLTAEKEVEVVAATAAVASPQLVDLKIYPPSRTLFEVEVAAGKTQEQQLVVVGIDQAGRAWDLTRTVGMQTLDFKDPTLKPLPGSNAAKLSNTGLLRGDVEGEDVLVMVRMDQFALVSGSHLHLGKGRSKPVARGSPFSGAPLAGSTNPIDQAVLQGLAARFVEPAALSSDGEFLRRLYSDALGRLPGEAETNAFLASTAANKREAEVDRVLAMPEFATQWGSRLGEYFVMTDVNFDTWATAQINANRTLPQIVGDLIRGTGQGGQLFDTRHGDAGLKVDILLLTGAGMTAECAKCHDHPVTGPMDTPRWIQADRYPLDAFFAATAQEAIPLDKQSQRTGNNGQPFQPGFAALDPTKTVVSTLTTPLAQRRDEFATLFLGSAQFRRGLAHRIWSDVAQQLLDPNQLIAKNLDSMKAPQVLTALAAGFEQTGGDLKGFLGLIFKSKTWQLTAEAKDTTNDSLLVRRLLRRNHSEACESLVRNVTGANPTNLGFFRDAFGFPLDRARIDERSTVVNMSQPLILMNSPTVQGNLAAGASRVGQLATDVAANTITSSQAVTTLFRAALSGDPSAAELSECLATIQAAPNVRAGLEDVGAVLLASIEAAAN
jgi:hypothetical protein